MHRLQIMVTKEQYRWLRAESYTRGKSIAEVIRELIAEKQNQNKKERFKWVKLRKSKENI